MGVLPYSERKEQTGRTTAPQCSAALLLQTVSRQAVATLRTLISTLTLHWHSSRHGQLQVLATAPAGGHHSHPGRDRLQPEPDREALQQVSHATQNTVMFPFSLEHKGCVALWQVSLSPPLAWRGERKRSNKSQVLLLRLKVMPILYTDTEPKMHSVHGQDSIAHVIGTFPFEFMCTENVVLFRYYY